MSLRLFITSILASIVLPAASGAMAQVTMSQHQAQPRPFWGTMTGEVTFVMSSECSTQPVQTVSTNEGRVSHLGNSTLTTAHCASSDGTQAIDGHAIFTGANGADINATYTAHTVAASAQVIVQEGELTIIGGTGRFQHAAGRVPFTVYISPVSPPTLEAKWPVRFVFAGTISY
ncbi:hypothetical protein [Occallatibacter riparius]|uniref:Uncharacterized protein n=1 Tax=Occallatibacter riparius TaxID=1002689 RepID=A0A9J7BHW1_9BACT|nr:hypothetical protein [Occallatibacter riparius]UWZ82303.1 hypothetical protein MOP44_17190 [Occallatibacter riparius]